VFGLAKRAAAIEIGCRLQCVSDIVVGLGDSSAAALIHNPAEGNGAVEPHLGQKPDDCALVFLLALFDQRSDDELIEDLPDSHRMIGLENGCDPGLDVVDLGAGAPVPSY